MPEKVPDPESLAGPGYWQCARCGKINHDNRDECGGCRDDPVAASTEQATLVDPDRDAEETEADDA